jgi:carbonic anhydrase/acetyltransferase-like protein (isoleucine patch superfamily)
MFPGVTVRLEEGAHIGHGAMVHGAHVGKNCMVGMNAVLLDDVKLGDESIVGALALVKAKSVWPKRSLVVGNPAILKGQVSDAMLTHKSEGTALYKALPGDAHQHMKEVEALTAEPDNRIEDFPSFETWQDRKAETDSPNK